MAQYGYSSGVFGEEGYGHRGLNKFRNGAVNGYSDDDRVFRQVITDSEGRKRPMVYPNNNKGSHVAKAETYVEHIYIPSGTDYKYVFPVRVDEYRISCPGKGDEYRYSSPTSGWRRPSSPVHGRPYEVEEFITNIQNEVSEPIRRTSLSAMNWRPPYSTNHNVGTGYGAYNDDDNSCRKEPTISSGLGRPKHGRLAKQPDTSGEYNDDDYSSRKEPTMILPSGWSRPKHGELAKQPDTSLTKPTSDIGEAMKILKEAAMPAQRVRFANPGPARPKDPETIDSAEAARRYGNFHGSSTPYSTGPTTIDSAEAARRYGNFNGSSWPYSTEAATIDSKEAMKKYKGAIV